MAAIAARHDEFLQAGARVFALSVDSPQQNAAVMEKLALPFPIVSDPGRDRAVTPLGFADERDPRLISRPGVMIVASGGAEAWRHTGRDYADRPHEDLLMAEVSKLGLAPTTQALPEVGDVVPGEKAIPLEGLPHYFRGAKFAALALRSRHRSISQEFKDDAKEYVARVERYLEALSVAEGRKA